MKSRIFTKDFFLVAIANFLVTAIYFLMITTMARYAMVTFDCPDSMGGLAASIFLIGGFLSRPLAGRYITKIGLKRSAVLSLCLMVITCVLYLVSDVSLVFLMMIRIVHGFAFGFSTTALTSIVVSTMPKEYMGTGIGYFMLSTTCGTAIGPMVGLLVTGGFDYNVLFLVCIGMSVVALVSTLLVKTGTRIPAPTAKEKFSLSSFVEKKTWKMSAFVLFVGFAYSAYNAFLNSYSISLDLGFFAPFSFLVYGLALILTRPIAGRLMDSRGENTVLYPSIISLAIGLVICAFVQNGAMLILVGVFMATGFGTSMSAGQAVATKQVTPEKSALAISTFYIFIDAGCGFGPYVLGLIVPIIGYSGMYLVAAGIALLGFVYYFFVHGRKAKQDSDIKDTVTRV